MNIRWLIATICLFRLAGFADKAVIEPQPEAVYDPWLTGPLIAPAAIPIPPGHYNIEPYIYATARTGFYNTNWKSNSIDTLWMINSETLVEIGLTSFMDFEFIPSFSYNFTEGAANWTFNDFTVLMNFQLYNEHFYDALNWNTALKFVIQEVFPTGTYKKLNPQKKLTDAGGLGSWQTSIGLVWGNLIHISKHHFFNSRLSFLYTYLTPVQVKGFNAYGGDRGTNGTIHLGNNFQLDLGLEYSLSQRWVLATDIIGTWQGTNSFTGHSVPNQTGVTPLQTGNKASIQYSLAPAIEYNWSENLGIIGGVWFTVAGKNTPNFTSTVIALNYYH